jgi:hypothetical protein
MAARRGNKSTYSNNLHAYASPDRTTVWHCGEDGSTITIRDWEKISEKDFRDYSDDDFIEAWKRACKRDPFVGVYDRLKSADRPRASLNCRDVSQALEFMYKATGDTNFLGAAVAMKLYGLTSGGLKKTVLGKMSNFRHAFWSAMPKMHVWIENEKVSPLKAAKLVAARHGIPGQSFETVVDGLRKTYPKWLKSISPAPEVGKTL